MVEYYSTVYSYSVRLGTSYEIMHSKARSSVLYGVISPAIWENVFFTDMQYLLGWNDFFLHMKLHI